MMILHSIYCVLIFNKCYDSACIYVHNFNLCPHTKTVKHYNKYKRILRKGVIRGVRFIGADSLKHRRQSLLCRALRLLTLEKAFGAF